jgi:DNA-binding protein YbaB
LLAGSTSSGDVTQNGLVNFQTGNPEIDRHMSKVFEQLDQFQTIQRDLAEARTTGLGADGLVEVTVGPSANLLDVTLNPRAMRLDSISVTEAIMEAYKAACDQMNVRLVEIMGPLMPAGVDAGGVVSSGLKVVGEDGTPMDPMAAVREAFEQVNRFKAR